MRFPIVIQKDSDSDFGVIHPAWDIGLTRISAWAQDSLIACCLYQPTLEPRSRLCVEKSPSNKHPL